MQGGVVRPASSGIPRQPKQPKPLYEPKAPLSNHLYDLEAEEQLLGALMFGDNYALMPVLKVLRPQHLCGIERGRYYPVILEAIARTWSRKLAEGKGSDVEVIEPIVVGEELKRMAKFSTVGGTNGLRRLVDCCASSKNVNVYTSVVIDCARRRGIGQAMGILHEACYAPNAVEYLQELMDATTITIRELKKYGYSTNHYNGIPLNKEES